MKCVRDAWNLLRTTLETVCFPAELTLCIGPFIRLIFTLYHLPSIALVLALTHSALERIVWVLIVPAAQDMEKQPYNSSHMTTFILGMYHIFHQVLPYSTLGVSVAVFGYKVLNCCVETMIDAHSTYEGRDYPLLALRLQFIMETNRRYYTFLCVLLFFMFFSIFSSSYTTFFLVLWQVREPWIIVSTWCIIMIQVMFIIISVIQHPQLPSGAFSIKCFLGYSDANNNNSNGNGKNGQFSFFFTHVWWKSYIHYMRYIAIEMIILNACGACFFFGPFYVLSSCIELLMYLNIPHLIGHIIMSITTFLVHVQESVHWIQSHRRRHNNTDNNNNNNSGGNMWLPVFFVSLPYQCILLHAIYYFYVHDYNQHNGDDYYIKVLKFLLLLWLYMILIVRSIDLVREFHVTKNGSIHWTHISEDGEGELIPPYLSLLLEEAYEKHISHLNVRHMNLFINMDTLTISSSLLNGEKKEKKINRTENKHYHFRKSLLYSPYFYFCNIPRVLSTQNPEYFGGILFHRVRVVLRVFLSCCLLIYTFLVVGLLFQSAFPQLRPWPVHIYTSEDNNILSIDHIVTHMHLLSTQSNTTPNIPFKSYITEPAFHAFKWNNITSVNKDVYPSLCNKQFFGISIWEISLLALTSYLFSDDEVNDMLRFMSIHMGSDWVIRERHGEDCVTIDSSTEPIGWDGYYDFYSHRHNLSVIAIRGTDMTSFRDFLIDVNVFFDVVLYHLFSNIIPGAILLPSELITDLIRLASIPPTRAAEHKTWNALISSSNRSLHLCENNNYRRDFFVDVYNHLTFLGRSANPPKHVLLTGHSLGGSVASIIGARMHIHAIGFSAPGISLSRKRFGIDLQSIHTYVTSVISSNDIFPLIGGNAGEQHNVECLAKTRELCHAMEFLVGTLWRSCGSIRAQYPSIMSVV